MKSIRSLIFNGVCAVTVAFPVAAQPTYSGSDAVIEVAEMLETREEQMIFLVSKINGFYNAEQYLDVVVLARHVLKLDPENARAQEMLKKALAELEKEGYLQYAPRLRQISVRSDKNSFGSTRFPFNCFLSQDL